MWGTAPVKQVCRTARRLGYTHLALTDTDNLCGLWPFLTACRREGLTPIVGAEVSDPQGKQRAVCLVANDSGYRNLCRLLTRRHMDADFDLAAAVISHANGLVILTQSADLLDTWHAAGVSIAATMPRRPLPATHRLRRTASRLGLPVVATPGSFFLLPDDVAVHRMLRAIERNTSLSRLPVDEVAPADAWLAAPEEYGRRSPDRSLVLSCRRCWAKTAVIRHNACGRKPMKVHGAVTAPNFPRRWWNGWNTSCAASRTWGLPPIF
jgi:DNA polymerase-3 subunit alpha/error-prone DNA polymerase